MLAGSLDLKFIADMQQAYDELKKLEAAASTAMGNIGKATSVVKRAFAAIGIGLSIAEFVSWTRQAIEATEAAGKMGQKIGVATKDVAGLQLAYSLAGLEAQAMQTSLTKLSTGIASGSKGLAAMGVQTKTAAGAYRETKDVLYEVADQFSTMRDGIAKTALAVDIFGKSGAEMIPLLNGGREGLAEMADMASRLGLVVTDEAAATPASSTTRSRSSACRARACPHRWRPSSCRRSTPWPAPSSRPSPKATTSDRYPTCSRPR